MMTSTGPPRSPSASCSPFRRELLTISVTSAGGLTAGRADVMASSMVSASLDGRMGLTNSSQLCFTLPCLMVPSSEMAPWMVSSV